MHGKDAKWTVYKDARILGIFVSENPPELAKYGPGVYRIDGPEGAIVTVIQDRDVKCA